MEDSKKLTPTLTFLVNSPTLRSHSRSTKNNTMLPLFSFIGYMEEDLNKGSRVNKTRLLSGKNKGGECPQYGKAHCIPTVWPFPKHKYLGVTNREVDKQTNQKIKHKILRPLLTVSPNRLQNKCSKQVDERKLRILDGLLSSPRFAHFEYILLWPDDWNIRYIVLTHQEKDERHSIIMMLLGSCLDSNFHSITWWCLLQL